VVAVSHLAVSNAILSPNVAVITLVGEGGWSWLETPFRIRIVGSVIDRS